ncbi:MAG: type II toxin-antitoxin system VapC family toxin [Limisphaerales bacterium]
MIALDTNLLVYAHQNKTEFHDAAKKLVASLREGIAPWAIPWPCIHEFLAVTTNPKAFKRPASFEQALQFVDALTATPQLSLLSESSGYIEKLRTIGPARELRGGRIDDARIAALCLHHGVRELWTADRDFSLFPQLKVRNPLVAT